MRRRPRAGGGWRAIWYTLKKGHQTGGVLRMYRALRSKNACKTCALGMGGQLGGMVNERGRFPEVCKKSVQAMAADMQGAIRPNFFTDFSFDRLRAFTPRELESAGRITQPLYAGPLDSHYREMSWDEAYERIAKKMRATRPNDSFFYFSGRSSNEAGFLLQLAARAYGTNNINNCSFYCHQASGVGLTSVTGSGTATIVLDDLELADTIFVIGANPSSNHPRFMRTLLDLRRRGGKVIVINPLREIGLVRFNVPSDARSLLFGSEIASLYVQPNIGGDIALLSGIAKTLIERGAIGKQYLHDHTDGWDECRASIEAMPWAAIIEQSGVRREAIDQIADIYAASERTIFCWAMGITHHEHGVENVQAIANLALLRGMVGKRGAGLLPLRGHSNVQGIGSMGVVPQLKGHVLERFEDALGFAAPTTAGSDTLECIEKAHRGEVRLALCLGGNLFGSNPDATFAHGALQRIDQIVYLSTTLNTGHVFGRGRETIVLPVLARDEEPQTTTQESMFNYVRLSEGGRTRYEGPRAESDVIAELAQRVMGDRADSPRIDWSALRSHAAIRALIAKVIPGYEAIGEIDRTKQEFHIGVRTFHEPSFATDTMRAKMHALALPAHSRLDEDELRLMTVRSEGQFNTVVYEEEDIYRGQERRDVIMMNVDDIARMKLSIDERVTVRSACGELPDILVRQGEIPPGNAAMYYPEANVLVPKVADARSKTPAFKHTRIAVSRQPSAVSAGRASSGA